MISDGEDSEESASPYIDKVLSDSKKDGFHFSMFDHEEPEPSQLIRLQSRRTVNQRDRDVYPPIERSSERKELSRDLKIPSILDIETSGDEKFAQLPRKEVEPRLFASVDEKKQS